LARALCELLRAVCRAPGLALDHLLLLELLEREGRHRLRRVTSAHYCSFHVCKVRREHQDGLQRRVEQKPLVCALPLDGGKDESMLLLLLLPLRL